MFNYMRNTFGSPAAQAGAAPLPAPAMPAPAAAPMAAQQGFRVAPVGTPPVASPPMFHAGMPAPQGDPRATVARAIMGRFGGRSY